jgi:hypothetical protein
MTRQVHPLARRSNKTRSIYRGKPLRWLKISSIVTFSVYIESWSTKSSGRSFDTGVDHWTSGCLLLSSTSVAKAAAVNALEQLAMSNSVSDVTWIPVSCASPYPYTGSRCSEFQWELNSCSQSQPTLVYMSSPLTTAMATPGTLYLFMVFSTSWWKSSVVCAMAY